MLFSILLDGEEMVSLSHIKALDDILDALGENELPFHLDGGCIERSRRHAQLLHWVSNRGQGFAANARVTADISRAACKELGMGLATTLATFETSGNVSDRRSLLELETICQEVWFQIPVPTSEL